MKNYEDGALRSTGVLRKAKLPPPPDAARKQAADIVESATTEPPRDPRAQSTDHMN